MILTNPELRLRAAKFAAEWKDAHYERGETQSFYNDFFDIFNVRRRRVAIYEKSVRKLGDRQGFVDLFWSGTLLVEQKSAGRDLIAAEVQALDYTHGLGDNEMPRYILACDFQSWRLTDLTLNETVTFTLPELADNIHHFAFILGRQRTKFKDQDPVNIKASELIGHLHDALEASGYTGHDLERFLVRIVFCLFADDTGIFEPKDILWDFLETQTKPDGSETGPKLQKIFDVLDQHPDKRSPHLAEEYKQFPHVNGALFSERIRIPDFDADMQAALLNACRFDWTPISPAIFGSLFQSVMDAKQRREKGAHYTTEKNIMKVIEPLFLDDLRTELRKIKGLRTGRRQRLEAFQNKLSSLTFFDPACGCGNFLIIAYREMRNLELEVMQAIKEMGELALLPSVIDVDQFYGIEYEEFPARIAETALWMMDHIMNRKQSDQFGELFVRIPLEKKATIVHGDALEVDWEDVLPAKKCSFVLGNPPFIGKEQQSPIQKAGLKRTLIPNGFKVGSLDYVTGWFVKACAFLSQSPNSSIAFVSTNSICQGEQVSLLWPLIFDKFNREIAFAHRTFEWGSDAKGKAHVHCIIVGMEHTNSIRKVRGLYDYETLASEPECIETSAISPYLINGQLLATPNLTVKKTRNPLSTRTKVVYGSKPCDDGNLVLSQDEQGYLLGQDERFSEFVKPLLGSKDSISGDYRYCLWLVGASPTLIKSSLFVTDRIRKVKEFRLKSTKSATQKDALTPSLFQEIRHTEGPFLLIPRHSSARRDYIPISRWNDGEVVHDSAFMMMDWELRDFALLTSAIFISWQDHVGGRIKSDWRFSSDLVYNTFPLPKGDLSKLDTFAQAILDARDNHPNSTLADLYDPDLMPPDLRRAHTALDKAVDKMYRRTGFASDRERVEHLFQMYEAMVKPLLAKPKRRKRVVKG